MRLATRKKLDGGLQKFFEGGFASDYFFCVSPAFTRQLDIALTSTGATQGSCFCFEKGDVFYDDKLAYKTIWQESKKHVNHIVRVLDAIASSIVLEEFDDGSKVKKVKKINDGFVTFSLVSKNENGEFDFKNAREISTNQFDFVEFLKTGKLDSEHLNLTNSKK